MAGFTQSEGKLSAVENKAKKSWVESNGPM